MMSLLTFHLNHHLIIHEVSALERNGLHQFSYPLKHVDGETETLVPHRSRTPMPLILPMPEGLRSDVAKG